MTPASLLTNSYFRQNQSEETVSLRQHLMEIQWVAKLLYSFEKLYHLSYVFKGLAYY